MMPDEKLIEYPSILNLFPRDPATHKLQFGNYSRPEFGDIYLWQLTEKIDGTNIRVVVNKQEMRILGRTVKAQLNPQVIEAVTRAVPSHATILKFFAAQKPSGILSDEWQITLFGEGYGPKVKGSKVMSYRKPEDGHWFRVFDVLYGEQHWADVNSVSEICHELHIDVAPSMSILTRDRLPVDYKQALQVLVDSAYQSSVASSENPDGADIMPEGVVARPFRPLFDVHGHRVIWKLKYADLLPGGTNVG